MIPDDENVSIERATFPELLTRPGRLYALGTDDYWLDMGTPEKYLQAHADVLAGRLGLPPAPGVAECAPGVWIEVGDPPAGLPGGPGDVGPGDVAEGPSAIEGPVMVGAGTRFDAGARVARSFVGRGCVLEVGSVVEDSVLLDGVQLGSGAQVRGSIVGPGTTIAPGAVLDGAVVGADAEIATSA
jgi:NDP-sugar pyrophosphorylase family protein